MIRRLNYILFTLLLLIALGASAQYSIDKVCVGAERYYRVSGELNSTYSWTITGPGGTVLPQLSDRDTIGIIWNMTPGIYQLSVVQHGQNGCDADMQLGTVEVFSQPVAFAGNPITACAGNSVILNEATASNYADLLWSTSGDGVFSNATLLNPTYQPGPNDIASGSFILTLTASGMGNTGACIPAVSSVMVHLNNLLVTAVSTPQSCSASTDGTVTLTAGGGTLPYSYTLNGITNTTGIFTNLLAGTYSYQVVDSISCPAGGTVTVGILTDLSATAIATPVDCYGAANGSILVSNAAGGTGSYEFSLDNTSWQSSNLFGSLPAGSYTVYMRDSAVSVCTLLVGTVEITQPDVLTAQISHTNITVPGADDGTITVVNADGGSGSYEFSLDGINWQSDSTFTNLAPGTYTVYLRDASVPGCFVILGEQTINNALTVTVNTTDASCFGLSDGQATAVVTGGTPPYTYLWNDPASQTSATINQLPAGIYMVLVTDAAGITATDTGTISQPAEVIVRFDTIAPLCLMSQAPILPDTSLNGITGQWTPPVISTVTAGISVYTFIPDAGQCADTVRISVEIMSEIVAQFTGIGPYCLNSTPELLPDTSLNGITGTWNPPVINTSTTGVSEYIFTPDAGQCAGITTISVTVSSPEITNIDSYTSTNGLANGRAVVEVNGLYPPMMYSLNGADWQASNEFRHLTAGSYTAYVTDSIGCTASRTFIILNTITGDVGLLAGDVESCISVPFEIPVMAYDFTNISAFTIQLEYDSTVIDFSGLTQVNSLLSNGNLTTSSPSPGILQISFTASDSVSFISEDMLFTLNFYGKASGHTDLQWNWLQCVVYSASGYEIPAIYTKGSVEIRPAPPVYVEGGGNYCVGTPLKISAGSLNGQSLTYQWTGPDGTTHNGNEWDLGNLEMTQSGKYMVTAYDSTACFKESDIDIRVNPNPNVFIAQYDTLCSDEPVVLSPGEGYSSYLWQDDSKDPQLVATNTGLYWVVVTDESGCSGSDSVFLHPCDLMIWIPNAFTPNGDELNDIFTARTTLDIDISFQMIIFNKWGEQIYSTNDIKKGWDGTYRGQPCQSDLYTWIIYFKAAPPYSFIQKSPQRGNVMLLR